LNGYGDPLIRKKPPNFHKTTKTSKQAYQQIAKKNKWPLSLEDVEIDTVGNFDVNGLPVYAVNIFSLSNLHYEEFYLMYEKEGKVHYWFMGTSEQFRKRALEHFEIATMEKIYLVMHFNEAYKDQDENTISSHVYLFVMAFDQKHRSKFLIYNVPLAMTDYETDKKNFLIFRILTDTSMVFNQQSKEIHESQKSLVGQHRIR
jgi:hypothetical protein